MQSQTGENPLSVGEERVIKETVNSFLFSVLKVPMISSVSSVIAASPEVVGPVLPAEISPDMKCMITPAPLGSSDQADFHRVRIQALKCTPPDSKNASAPSEGKSADAATVPLSVSPSDGAAAASCTSSKCLCVAAESKMVDVIAASTANHIDYDGLSAKSFSTPLYAYKIKCERERFIGRYVVTGNAASGAPFINALLAEDRLVRARLQKDRLPLLRAQAQLMVPRLDFDLLIGLCMRNLVQAVYTETPLQHVLLNLDETITDREVWRLLAQKHGYGPLDAAQDVSPKTEWTSSLPKFVRCYAQKMIRSQPRSYEQYTVVWSAENECWVLTGYISSACYGDGRTFFGASELAFFPTFHSKTRGKPTAVSKANGLEMLRGCLPSSCFFTTASRVIINDQVTAGSFQLNRSDAWPSFCPLSPQTVDQDGAMPPSVPMTPRQPSVSISVSSDGSATSTTTPVSGESASA